MKKILVFLIFLLVLIPLKKTFAQGIEVITRNQNDKIVVRWVPLSADIWRQGIINGYFIKRTLTHQGGVLVANPQPFEILNSNIPIKPKPNQSDWNSAFISPDSVFAKSLKSDIETVILENNSPTISPDNWEELYDLSVETADLSFQSAVLAGLGFIDNSAPGNNTYKYEVYLANNSSIKGFESNGSFFSIPTHKIRGVENFKTKISINWNSDTLSTLPNNSYYVKYYVERAIDNESFILQNKVPFVYGVFSTNPSTLPPSNNNSGTTLPQALNYIIWNDTSLVYGKTHKYRLKAVTLFGESSYSPEISLYVKIDIPYVPRITQSQFVNTNLCVNWRFPSDTIINGIQNSLSGFIVQKSTKREGSFQNLFPQGSSNILISKNDTSKCFTNMASKYYIRVVALTIDGDSLFSIPNLIFPEDSIKPYPPVNLVAVLNSATGIATITWSPDSRDNDIKGYKLYKSNLLAEEPTEIHKEILFSPTYIDTLKNSNPLVTAFYKIDNPKAYYYVSAIDNNFNESDLSNPVLLLKPDKTPPLSPRISKHSNVNASINIYWENSASKDVKLHKLVRAQVTSFDTPPPYNWQIKASFINTGDSTYLDNSISQAGYYIYGIIAVDSTNNETISNLVIVDVDVSTLPKSNFVNFNGGFNSNLNSIDLSWSYSASNLMGYQLYKSELNSPLIFWKIVKNTVVSEKDSDIIDGKTYKYGIRAAYLDGKFSNLKEISVSVPVKNLISTDSRYISFSHNGSPQSLQISSNSSWNITNIPTWVSFSFTSGTGNKTITISPQLNSSTSSRVQNVKIFIPGDTIYLELFQEKEEKGIGLLAHYFSTPNLQDAYSMNAQVKKIDETINLPSTWSPPIEGMLGNYAVVWEGYIAVPTSGQYTFFAAGDDGFKFYIGDELKIQGNSNNYNNEISSSQITLQAGTKVPIKMEYWNSEDQSGVYLKWSSNVGTVKSIIPKDYLFPKEMPKPDDADLLANKCFFIQDQEIYKYLEAQSNFLVRPMDFNGRPEQVWKFEKIATNKYKIKTLIDEQERIIQIINPNLENYLPIAQGFFSNLDHQKWTLNRTEINKYHIKTFNEGYGIINLQNYEDRKNVIAQGPGAEYKLIQTACNSTDKSFSVNKNEIVFLPQGQSQTFSIETGIGWLIEQSGTWYSVDVNAGYGSKNINLSAPPNNTEEVKLGFITIKSPYQTKTIQIKQSPIPFDCVANGIKVNNSKILNGTKIKEKACVEINLEEGFETEEFGEYETELIDP